MTIVDWKLFVALVSLLITLLFSASETALTSLGKLEIQTLMSRGGKVSRLIQIWIREPNRILITVLVGNNIVTVAASSLFALWANERYRPVSASVMMVLFTLVLIVGSEIIPKLWARQAALQVFPWAMNFLKVVGFILTPLIFVLHRFSSGLVFLAGRTGREPRMLISEEDLTQTIEIATKEGGIDRETGEVLSNLIDFPDRIARDVMTPRSRIQALAVGWTLDEAIRFISADSHSRYPVMRTSLDEIIGVLLVKDLLAHAHKSGSGSWTRVIRRPYFLSEVAPLGTILRDMRRWGTHMALVRNETGVLTGLLTMEDLIEEIVGDIRDEHDEPSDAAAGYAMGGPRIVNGEIPIIDFNDIYGGTLPLDVSYSTLNGYLLTKTGGQIPPVGTMIFGDDITFRIHSISDKGIATFEIIGSTQD